MESFCIKTNQEDIINYLLNKIQKIDFENLIYSRNKFKIYNNVIVHFEGNRDVFSYILSDVISDAVIKFYEEKLIRQILNYNYFYFDEYERNIILENSIDIIESDDEIQTKPRKETIKDSIFSYIQVNKAMVLDGFVNFRLKDYTSYLDNVIDTAVNQYIIEKEYNEFISLLKIYVDSKPSNCDVLHLIYFNEESILLDSNKNIVNVSDNILNRKYLSDISFSSNDYALNTLLTLLPAKIEIHLIDDIEDEFINTIKLIFDGRISICRDCNICRTYKILNHATIK